MKKIKHTEKQKSAAFDSFKQQKSILSEIKVNIMFGFICDIGAKVPSNKAMPISIILSVKLIFQVSSHLLRGVHLL